MGRRDRNVRGGVFSGGFRAASRCSGALLRVRTDANSNSDPHSDANRDSMYGKMHTDTAAAPDTAPTPDPAMNCRYSIYLKQTLQTK